MHGTRKLGLAAGLLLVAFGLSGTEGQAAGINSPLLARPAGVDTNAVTPVRWCWFGYWAWVPGPYCYGPGPGVYFGGPYWGGYRRWGPRGYWGGYRGPVGVYRGPVYGGRRFR